MLRTVFVLVTALLKDCTKRCYNSGRSARACPGLARRPHALPGAVGRAIPTCCAVQCRALYGTNCRTLEKHTLLGTQSSSLANGAQAKAGRPIQSRGRRGRDWIRLAPRTVGLLSVSGRLSHRLRVGETQRVRRIVTAPLLRLPLACENCFGVDFRPLSSCRSPQAALKLSYRSDGVTRY